MSGEKEEKKGKVDPRVHLAKEAVEAYIREGRKVTPRSPLSEELKGKAGVFASLKKGGALRGCIGTFMGTRDNLAEEIISSAIGSATGDPRFWPVTPEELLELGYSVDVLTLPEPVSGPEKLDAKRYGVIVESEGRRGLLLPDLEGVDTPAQQIEICKQKAGILPWEPVKLYRFEVKRYQGTPCGTLCGFCKECPPITE